MDEGDRGEDGVFPAKNVRALKQTTMATATRTRKKKRSNWQNNSSARAFHNFVHFLAVPCNSPQLASSTNRNRDGKLF